MTRANLSAEYMWDRKSVRLWSIKGKSLNDMWGDVGEFLHGPLGISEDEFGQDNIESVRQAPLTTTVGLVHDKVIVTFVDKKKRDLVMVSSSNLAGAVDQSGKPTAGTRMEIPEELADTFRLLSRFGTRLRARHGNGTRRHIKFDDFKGSLYCNIKLTGDLEWTKVSPEMARADLAASTREVNAANQARLAAKLILGPRERLAR